MPAGAVTDPPPEPVATGPQFPSQMLTLEGFQQGILRGEGSNIYSVSPKGALGTWQVMPETARNPGFNITPAASLTDPNELNRVGREYSAAMYNKYGPIIGAAAYNWGPGNVDKLLLSGDPRKGEISWEAWKNKLPRETQQYLAKVGGGSLAIPDQRNPPGPNIFATSTQEQRNPLALPQQDIQQPDVKGLMAWAMMKALLPPGMGFHPIDYNPFKAAYEKGLTPPSPVDWNRLGGSPARVIIGEAMGAPSTQAYSPKTQPRVGQKGAQE